MQTYPIYKSGQNHIKGEKATASKQLEYITKSHIATHTILF